MLNFLFKKETKVNNSQLLNEFYGKLKEKYNFDSISEDRKNNLAEMMNTYGYIPYSYAKALEELTDAEVLYSLEYKWKANNVLDLEGRFVFTNPSVLARNNVLNSDWIKREGHNIKLINLAGLGNGNKTENPGTFMDWLRQLVILPTGNLSQGIFNTTLYLIPFHPREFGCAYLPTSSAVSSKLEDKELTELTGQDVERQVKNFIMMAQLAGHPVIYDVLPQTGRYSKAVLSHPYIARWYDINGLIEELYKSLDKICSEINDVNQDDLKIVKDIYKQSLKSGIGTLTDYYQEIYNKIDTLMLTEKKYLSNAMLERSIQDKLHKKAAAIIATIVGKNKKLEESDINNQGEIIQLLISEGMWPAPGGAWCSAGVPVFDRMSECGSYPVFKHFDYKDTDVSEFANLDCQTPFYFVCLENGKFNNDVITYFINSMKKLQKDYNFDGFRVDHIDHIVDAVSEKDGIPISYRAPRKVLGMMNSAMKEHVLYFATLAEYMLWDNYLKEYHEDMGFDLLWGNDIVSQSFKHPQAITEDNTALSNYNIESGKKNMLSILKTYNNQDGEFEAIDRYPGQLGFDGALFKWFKYKFLPGGKNAQRPTLYIDGDESFTKIGIERVIGSEVSMVRERNDEFFAKFDAIDRFVKNNDIIVNGEAHVVRQDDDGFTVWQISKEGIKNALLVVANNQAPTEKILVEDNGKSYTEIREGREVFDKDITLPCDYEIVSEYRYNGVNFIEEQLSVPLTELSIGK
ncbi:MAG: hypothetical protein ACI4S3_06825, partial [Candidatus Gastranaerophilaceae bacterium]